MLTSRFAPAAAFLALLSLSRVALSAMGVAPDPVVVAEHWQNLDLSLLASDPLGSLWNLQAQPPLWNALLAVAAQIAGPDAAAVTAVVTAFNFALTAAAGLFLASALARIGLGPWLATAFALAASCSPNVVYFEAIAFYAHLTFFHVALLLWLLTRVSRNGPLWPVAGSLGVLVSITWTWAIFHPVFVAVYAGALVLWARGWTPVGRSLLAFAAAAALLAAIPTIKNAMLIGLPSASGWIGLNLAQTAPGGQVGALAGCDFVTAQRDAAATPPPDAANLHPVLSQMQKSSGHPNFNHIGLVERSKVCLGLARGAILADPAGWAGQRIAALFGSHQLNSFDYDVDPVGWTTLMGPAERALHASGAVGRSFMILLYLGLWMFALRRAQAGETLYVFLLAFMAYFTLTSHALNGGEQARMRYTIEPIYLFLSAGLLTSVLRRRSHSQRPSAPQAYSPNATAIQ
ncbi:hypothetical protein GC169_11520 [bacterium]|nr:hypothetical protein [bacterium]